MQAPADALPPVLSDSVSRPAEPLARFERRKTVRDVLPTVADMAATDAGVADGPTTATNQSFDPARIEVDDRVASYREFGARLASGFAAVALLAAFVALVAGLR